MAKQKQSSVPAEPTLPAYKLNAEEAERMKKYLEVLSGRQEFIELVANNSYFFADWSIFINEAVLSAIEKKQEQKLPYDEEREMLGHLSYFFTKAAYFSNLFSDWNREMTAGKENIKTMIRQGE
jgi:hypothetical protein